MTGCCEKDPTHLKPSITVRGKKTHTVTENPCRFLSQSTEVRVSRAVYRSAEQCLFLSVPPVFLLPQTQAMNYDPGYEWRPEKVPLALMNGTGTRQEDVRMCKSKVLHHIQPHRLSVPSL